MKCPVTDDNTKYITLIGTPLKQSFAARMQNRAYEALGLDLHYFNTEADETRLGEIIDDIRRSPSFCGAAVTKPNKVGVIRYLDELDPLCERICACNTVVKLPDGRLRGYNTDAIGFYRSLTEDAGVSVRGKSFLCLGAGGAGRAICSALAYYGAEKIYISSLTPASRESAAHDINTNFSPIAEAVATCDTALIRDCDVIINATGVGMGKTFGQSPLKKELMLPGKLYFDACYNPEKTRFLSDAEAAGGRILNGLGMSLYQGAAQIELWSGEKAPVDVMRSELLTMISEKNDR